MEGRQIALLAMQVEPTEMGFAMSLSSMKREVRPDPPEIVVAVEVGVVIVIPPSVNGPYPRL